MKWILSLFALFLMAFGNINQAQAGLLIEPYIGYEISGTVKGDFDYEFSGVDGSLEVDDKTSGLLYGGRVGYMLPFGLSLGGEYQTGAPTVDEGKSTIAAYGPFIGYTFPVMLRLYATYFLKSTIDIDYDDDSVLDMDGTGFKVGLGYMPFSFLSINFEYLSTSYTEMDYTTDDGDEVDISNAKINATGYVLSLSFPFDI